jgi:hypothetical protein
MTVASAAIIAWPYANLFNRLTAILSVAFLMGFVVVNRPKRRGVRPGKGPAAT